MDKEKYISEGLEYVESCILNVWKDPEPISKDDKEFVEKSLERLYEQSFDVDWLSEDIEEDDFKAQREYISGWANEVESSGGIFNFCKAFAIERYHD